MKRLLVLVLVVLMACAPIAASAVDFGGVTVNALIFKSTDTDYMIEVLAPKLLEEANINLVVNQVPYEEVRATMLTDAYGAQQYDIINPCTEWVYEYFDFATPITEYIGAEGYPEMDLDDYIEFVWDGFNWTEDIYFLPYQPDTRVFFWREDLLEAEGLSVPTTWDELLETAAALTKDTDGDGTVDQYGFVFSGARGWNELLTWVPFTYSAGGMIFDDRTPVFNSPEAVDAINLLIELKQYCPPDVEAYGEYEVIAAAQNGSCAMGVSATSICSEIESDASSVKGLIKSGTFPVKSADTDVKYTAAMGGWALGVSNYSEKKDAAAYACQFITNKENSTAMEIAGRAHAARKSQGVNEELLTVNPHVPGIIAVLEGSKLWFEGSEGAALGEIVLVHINKAVCEEVTPEQALADAEAEVLAYLEENA
ncbi:MAG: extracellular solute-binding protein [Clostridia bacterium]|nr:extracellular solute-binding protein [Clostridia bacterium]